MSKEEGKIPSIIDRENLPDQYPTHMQLPEFWEQLGRTIATFGFLEEVLGKAIFAFTATREYPPEEVEEAYKAWLPKLEKALTDQLWNLAESYGKAVKEHHGSTIQNVDDLIDNIKKAREYRNVLCHGSWRTPDENGKSIPFFINKQNEKFETPIDTAFLSRIQAHVLELSCSVIDSVTHMGWEFPGGAGLGKTIWPSKKP